MTWLPYAYKAEVWQLAVSAAAAAYLLWALMTALHVEEKRIRAHRLDDDARLAVISRGNLLRATFRFMKSVTFLAVGAVSVLMPPPYHALEAMDPVAVLQLEHGNTIVRYLVITATVILLVDAMVERWFIGPLYVAACEDAIRREREKGNV